MTRHYLSVPLLSIQQLRTLSQQTLLLFRRDRVQEAHHATRRGGVPREESLVLPREWYPLISMQRFSE
jgi:hypothetical protein